MKRMNGGAYVAEIGAELAQLAQDFEDCRKLLIALGDENRQHLILEMVRLGRCTGVRVASLRHSRTSRVRRSRTICRFSRMRAS